MSYTQTPSPIQDNDDVFSSGGCSIRSKEMEPQIPVRRSLSVGCREISENDYDTIVKQVEFYFSEHNLPYDVFMKNLIQESKNVHDNDPMLSGWIPLTTILTFNRMKKWRPIDKISTILVEHSTKLEVSKEGDFIRPKNMKEIDFLMDTKRMKQFFNEQCSRSCVLSNFYLNDQQLEDEKDIDRAKANQSRNLEQVEKYLNETFCSSFEFKQIRLKYKHKKFADNNTMKLFANSIVLELANEETCNDFIECIGKNNYMHNEHQLQCMSKRLYGITKASTKRVDKKFQGVHKITQRRLSSSVSNV